MGKKVSIILPAYNGEKYISKSIESVINQTYENWELIIVNDGSTDSTPYICKKYAEEDSRIRIITNETNLKLPNTLNIGFEEATGEYYSWTSCDNIYKPQAIEVLSSTLDQNPDVDMVYSNFTNIDAEGNEKKDIVLREPEYLIAGNVFGFCFMYTAEIAKKIGKYDANLFLAEDYDFWMRVYCCGKMMHIPDNLYWTRRHSESLTQTRKSSVNRQTYKALEKNFLPLYVDAKKHNLVHEFFDHMLVRSEGQRDEVKKMLIMVDAEYEEYLKNKDSGKSGNKVPELTIFNKFAKKFKSMVKRS